MRAHIIKDGVVVNTIEVESLKFMPGLVAATVGGPGWLYDGTTFTPPAEDSPAPTKEELLAQLQTLQTQIQSLG